MILLNIQIGYIAHNNKTKLKVLCCDADSWQMGDMLKYIISIANFIVEQMQKNTDCRHIYVINII